MRVDDKAVRERGSASSISAGAGGPWNTDSNEISGFPGNLRFKRRTRKIPAAERLKQNTTSCFVMHRQRHKSKERRHNEINTGRAAATKEQRSRSRSRDTMVHGTTVDHASGRAAGACSGECARVKHTNFIFMFEKYVKKVFPLQIQLF